MVSSILLVGCGNMGRALLRGWLRKGGNPTSIHVVNRSLDTLTEFQTAGCHCVTSRSQIPPTFQPQTVVLAVKPQGVSAVARDYKSYSEAGAAVISIAAGIKLAALENVLGTRAAIMRAMPNTPAAISRGITVSVANSVVTQAQRDMSDVLLGAVGETAWVTDECLMDAVTGVSGSGPAYVFYMIEALTLAGIKEGLPEELATQLAKATVAGAGELARQDELSVTQLRQNVTSRNGTTEAGLQQLMDHHTGLAPLMAKAVKAAKDRSKELSNE